MNKKGHVIIRANKITEKYAVDEMAKAAGN